MTLVCVYVLFENFQEAERVGAILVEERLAACANILGSVRSIYRWDGEITKSDECAAILKTLDVRADELIERVAELHSYKVPCITSWPIGKCDRSYAKWMREALSLD